jgi:hypothetical protein
MADTVISGFRKKGADASFSWTSSELLPWRSGAPVLRAKGRTEMRAASRSLVLLLGLLATRAAAPIGLRMQPPLLSDDEAADVDGLGGDDSDDEPRLIFYYETGILSPGWSENNPVATVMKQAAACGYTEMVVADGALQGWDPVPTSLAANLSLWQDYAASLNISLIPLIFPFSVPEYTIYASSPLGEELAEPLFSSGAPFEVSADGRRLVHTPTAFLTNGNFSAHDSGGFRGWRLQRPGERMFVDETVTYSSGASLRIGPGFGPAMAFQPLTHVPARRQIAVSFWAKSANFSTVQYNVELCKIDKSQPFALGQRISWHSMVINSTQEWTQFSFTSSSWDGGLGLFVGLQPDVWYANGTNNPSLQPMNGTLWFDDIQVSDTALHNVVRRDGAPLRVYDATTGAKYSEVRKKQIFCAILY